MARRTGDIAKSIELMLVRPRATPADCIDLCELALTHHVAAVCVQPTHVAAAASVLRGTDVKLVALISHPFGGDRPEIKARACVQAIREGAQEVEIAADLAQFAGGDPNYVRDELRRCAAAAREADTEVLVRGVIDTGVFDDRTLRLLARAVVAAEVDMLVTSSGLSPEPNDVLDVELMREEVGAEIGVKAVRGVRGFDEVSALLVAGASRVGATSVDLLVADV
jgi:deoxyribose-phosphate aldolase